jgi:hypothetical protein
MFYTGEFAFQPPLSAGIIIGLSSLLFARQGEKRRSIDTVWYIHMYRARLTSWPCCILLC